MLYITRTDRKNASSLRYLPDLQHLSEFTNRFAICSVSDKLRYVTDIQQSSISSENVKMSDTKVLQFTADELWQLVQTDKRFQGKYILVVDTLTGVQAIVYWVPDNRWSKGLYKETFFK